MNYDFETRNPAEGVLHPMLEGRGITDPAIIPYAVAEMRFDIAPEIKAFMHQCVDTGSFGYTRPSDSYMDAVCSWMERRHGWKIERDWVIQSYGVVSALSACVKAFTKPGEGVLIQTPVYPPFSRSVLSNGRKLVTSQLVRRGNSYEIDFDDFERKVKECKLFILCSPHNPVGRVWTADELKKMADICIENGVIIASDEIHHDLVLPGYKHHTICNAAPQAADHTIVCTAPSKTFNIAGLSTSNIIVPNEKLRKSFSEQMEGFLNVVGLAACEAAYSKAEGWLEECLVYLDGNRAFVEDFIGKRLPQIGLTKLEGSYLMWLDMSALGLDKDGLQKMLIEKAQLMVNDGESFGSGGEGFIRFNIACPRRYIEQALLRLEAAIKG